MAWREDIETSQPRSRPPMSASPAAPFPPYFDEPSSPPSHRKASLGQSSYAYDNGETRWGGSESTKKAKAPFPRAFIDTFRRAPMSRYTEPEFALEDDAEWDQIHHQLKASHYTTNTGLARKLKGRHLQMIAIGGSIGK